MISFETIKISFLSSQCYVYLNIERVQSALLQGLTLNLIRIFPCNFNIQLQMLLDNSHSNWMNSSVRTSN